MTLDLTRRREEIQERVARAAARVGRSPDDVRVIAVTKDVEVERIAEAIHAGVTDIGESRVQEARAKRARLDGDVAWHLLGHLQTNKARQAADCFDVIHSIDSARVATTVGAARDPDAVPLEALVEVELGDVETRTGVRPADAEAVVRGCAGLYGIHLVGLMTIAPRGGSEIAKVAFRQLRELRDHLERVTSCPLPELSMGMSNDFEIAVEEGATMVRLGRALFGDRPAP